MKIRSSNEPQRIVVKLTNQCNMACSFCSQAINRSKGNLKKSFFNYDQFVSFLQPEFMNPNKVLYLWGGEPLLHPNWKAFADYGKSKGWRVQLNTNGWLLEENKENILNSVDDLIISLDGLSKTHDILRRKKGAYNRIEKNIKLLGEFANKKSVSVTINTVVTETLLNEISIFADVVMAWDIQGIVFELPTFIIPQKENSIKEYFNENCWKYSDTIAYLNDYSIFPADYFISLYKKISDKYPRKIALTPNLKSFAQVRDYFNTTQKLGIAVCPEINLGLVMEPDGRIISCSDFPDTYIGTYINNNWQKIWLSSKYIQVRNAFSKYNPPAICYRCCQTLWEI